ncbi:restriction endonuclease subunit S [Campylobacter sp.]|uniref:restriction endonuclease subunit S n=1 Tax=Campylobacter sp. TaxID=205 RepID=UPI002AA8A40F|nr:restriction endonuclease subunit S [Campylobacter sp.]MCI7581554.1 restriction endonuclease subunit S [Campylobacter sp.]
MNTKHLKTRILDLALQGKLVENSRIPNDLNSRIPSDFNPPFGIPNSWEWVKLGDICEISSGGTPSRNEAEFWENGTIPWLKIADIKDDYVNSSSEFITQKGLENSSAKIFKKGTLLFTIFATLGEVAILNIDASTNQAIVGLTPKKDNYITKFIFFALKNIKNSVNLIGRGATQKNINQTILKNFYIPLPPLDEQERIVKKIDELFSQIDILDKHKESLLKNIKHTKTRILDLALQGKLVKNSRIPNDVKSRIPSDFNPPFEIPNSWQWVKLGEIVSVTDFVANGSFATLRENVKYYNEKNYAILVRLADFTKNWDNNYIYCDKHAYDFLKKSSLKPNDIVMCNVGSLGVTFKVPDLGQPMTLAPNSILIRPLNKNILNDFLFYLFNSLFFKNSLNTIKSSTTQPKFNKTDFKTIYIPLPPKDEQEKIVKKIDELFEILEIIENSL